MEDVKVIRCKNCTIDYAIRMGNNTAENSADFLLSEGISTSKILLIIDKIVKLKFNEKIKRIKKNLTKIIRLSECEKKQIDRTEKIFFVNEEDAYEQQEEEEKKKEEKKKEKEEKEEKEEDEYYNIYELILGGGEENKNRKTKKIIESFLLQFAFDKTSVVFAVGGGVIGDVVGFACSTYYRGTRYVQMPTTLLSMVDSSVGGKTAINTLYGKNLIGAIHQPVYVLIDYTFLHSLSDRHIINGLAECVKIGITSHPRIFELCEELASTHIRNMDIVKQLIYLSVEYKKEVVMEDERDAFRRNVLNFGHTIGHAIEMLPTNQLLHGECVSIGCVYELMASRALGYVSASLVQRAEACFSSLNLPTKLTHTYEMYYNKIYKHNCYYDFYKDEKSKYGYKHNSNNQNDAVSCIMKNMSLDKKNRGGCKYIVIVTALGSTVPDIMKPVPDSLLLRILSPAVRVVFPPKQNDENFTQNSQNENENIFTSSPPLPLGTVNGSVRLPGSKAISNRALLLSAMGSGSCSVRNLPPCEDVNNMLDNLKKKLNFHVNYISKKHINSKNNNNKKEEKEKKKEEEEEEEVTIRGIGLMPPSTSLHINDLKNYFNDAENYNNLHGDEHAKLDIWVENAGTVCRFICPFLAIILMKNIFEENEQESNKNNKKIINEIRVDGNQHMRKRPIKDLMDAMLLAFPLLNVHYEGTEGYLPLVFKLKNLYTYCVANHKELLHWADFFPGGEICINNKLSSQYVSAMLLVAPLAASNLQLNLTYLQEKASPSGSAIVSEPFIKMTIEMMKVWGVHTQQINVHTFKVCTGTYVNPHTYTVEGDAASASYPLAFAAITGGKVSVNLTHPKSSLQGDAKFVYLLERMGCKVESEASWTSVEGPSRGELKCVKEDLSDLTDTFMTAAVLMARACQVAAYRNEGENYCEITNIANQRVKECNRINAMFFNFLKLGISACELEDGIRIYPPKIKEEKEKKKEEKEKKKKEEEVIISCYSDHRIAMSFAVFSALRTNLHIPQWRCVEKTFSTFWDMCEGDLGLQILHSNATDQQSFFNQKNPPIFLIGMRNSYKTTLGRIYAKETNMHFVDLDEEIVNEYYDILCTESICKNNNNENNNNNNNNNNEEEEEKTKLNKILSKVGWREFRRMEMNVLYKYVAFNTNKKNAHIRKKEKEKKEEKEEEEEEEKQMIVSCGGGIVESSEVVTLLTNQPFVIWMKMNENDVLKLCKEEKVKPPYDVSVEEKYRQRKPFYQQLSKYEFVVPSLENMQKKGFLINKEEEEKINKMSEQEKNAYETNMYNTKIYLSFKKFMQNICYPSPLPLENSYFLSLTFSDYSSLPEHTLRELRQTFREVDAVEIRTDFLEDINTLDEQMFYLRQVEGLPSVILTCRSVDEGGRYEGDIHEYLNICKKHMKCAADFIDIELYKIMYNSHKIKKNSNNNYNNNYVYNEMLNDILLCTYNRNSIRPLSTKIIASYHKYTKNTKKKYAFLYNNVYSNVKTHIKKLCIEGVDVIKVVYNTNNNDSNNYNNIHFDNIIKKMCMDIQKPIIGIIMKEENVLSRILNKYFSPVTHTCILNKAAKGQLDIHTIKNIRKNINIYYEKYFYVVGYPVCFSASPTLHNTAFNICNYNNYKFLLYDTLEKKNIYSLITSPHFGGMSVTIPHKTYAHMYVQKQDDAAKHIGAINTIYVNEKGVICGSNTDYLAIIRAIQTHCHNYENSNALVLGSGGTARAACFAVKKLNMNLYIYNRTKSKLKKLCKVFNGVEFEYQNYTNKQVCETPHTNLHMPSKFTTIISAIPGYAELELPEEIFVHKPLIVEVAYHPPLTPIIKKSRQYGCAEVLGIDILIWQGYEQNKLFTNRKTNFSEEEEKIIQNEVLLFYQKMFHLDIQHIRQSL